MLHHEGSYEPTHSARRWEHGPFAVIQELITKSPKADKKTLFEQFREVLAQDETYQRAVDWYYFGNMYDYLTTNRNKHRSRNKSAQRAIVDKLKQRLLDLILPNGKALRDATFAECATAGGWFTKVSKLGKPQQIVGKIVSEEQLKAITFQIAMGKRR
jgi:radical SAM superfamily enzyme with C-terminal helix-hairpin-helix motif